MKKDRGVYAVIFALFATAVIMLVAVVIAAAFLSVNRATYQNAVNSASLASLERYIRGEETSALEKEAAAIARANTEVLNLNQLKSFGSFSNLGQLSEKGGGGKGGEVIFGRWRPEDDSPPSSCDPPRRAEFPCFVDDPNMVNAVKIVAKSPDPFKIPFGAMFGSEGVTLETEAIATVVPRCVVFILDASLSSSEETHKSFGGANEITWYRAGPMGPMDSDPLLDPLCANQSFVGFDPLMPPRGKNYACPRDAALFAFDQWELYPSFAAPQDLLHPINSPCRNAFDPIYSTPQGRRWCNLSFSNGNWRSTGYPDEAPNYPPRTHFIDHYRRMNTVYGQMLVDTVIDPVPLHHFLAAFNAGLLLVQGQSSLMDRAKLLAFKGNVFDQEPKGQDFRGSGDLEPLIQLTNPDNIKGSPIIYPNYVSRGWFGRFNDTTATPTGFTADPKTNVIGALWRAITLLGDSSKCPTSARKVIVLASDGVMNCTETEEGTRSCGTDSETGWNHFLAAENMLLQGNGSILRKMQEGKIAFTALVAGKAIGPNFVDHLDPDGNFIDYSNPLVYDLGGMPNDSRQLDYWMTDPRSTAALCTTAGGGPCATQDDIDRFAFVNFGKPGVVFRRPNGILAELAAKTGGLYCPLLQLPATNTFDDYLDHDDDEKGACGSTNCCPKCTPRILKAAGGGGGTVRADKLMLTQPQRYLSEGEQAAMCVIETIGLNPFQLVQEDIVAAASE